MGGEAIGALHQSGPFINMGVEGEDGMGLTAGNLSLPGYQVAVGFGDGSDPVRARAFAERVVNRLKTRWDVETVPAGEGAFPLKACEQSRHVRLMTFPFGARRFVGPRIWRSITQSQAHRRVAPTHNCIQEASYCQQRSPCLDGTLADEGTSVHFSPKTFFASAAMVSRVLEGSFALSNRSIQRETIAVSMRLMLLSLAHS